MKTIFTLILAMYASCLLAQTDCSNVYTPETNGIYLVTTEPSCGTAQNFSVNFENFKLNNPEHVYEWGIDVPSMILPPGYTYVSQAPNGSYEHPVFNRTIWRTKITFSAPATGGGVIKIRLYAKCTATIKNYSSYSEITINRPSPAVTILGDNYLCTGNTKTFSINTPSSIYSSINWSGTGGLSLSGSTTGSSVSALSNTTSGYGTITAATTDICGNSVNNVKNIAVGVPDPFQITHEISGAGTNVTSANTFNYMQLNKWYRIKYNSSFSNITSYNWNPTTNGWVDGYINGNDYVFMLLSGPPSGYLTLKASASNGCGVSTERTMSFLVGSSPFLMANPVTNGTLSVGFSDASTAEALPESLELIDEKTSKSVWSIDAKGKKSEEILSNKRLDINVRNLKNGTYYLKSGGGASEGKTTRVIIAN